VQVSATLVANTDDRKVDLLAGGQSGRGLVAQCNIGRQDCQRSIGGGGF
jgi:hypothetical protein